MALLRYKEAITEAVFYDKLGVDVGTRNPRVSSGHIKIIRIHNKTLCLLCGYYADF